MAWRASVAASSATRSSRACISPDSSPSIRSTSVSSNSRMRRGTWLPLPSILPYEVFYRRTPAGETENLMVAWFNEDVLWSDDPLEQLHRLFARIAYGEKAENKRDDLTIKVLGPGSSGILKQMVRELREDYLVRPKGEARGEAAGRDVPDEPGRVLRLFADRVGRESGRGHDRGIDVPARRDRQGEGAARDKQLVEAEFRCRGIILRRTTVTDEKLADALSDELQLRGAWQTVSGTLGFGAATPPTTASSRPFANRPTWCSCPSGILTTGVSSRASCAMRCSPTCPTEGAGNGVLRRATGRWQ